jgi:hypothetical protein
VLEIAPNHLVDPWGRAYRYYYQPGGAWRAAVFVLFSGGPDGVVVLPFPVHGLVTPEFEAATVDGRPANADNLYAHRN